MELIIFISGLIIGSFLSAVTWRLPRGSNFISDRSRCDLCGNKIYWYDNIPLFSFIILNGKCRSCGKKISFRYPLIELATGLLFLLIYFVLSSCSVNFKIQPDNLFNLCYINNTLKVLSLPYFLSVTALMIAIFVTDFEEQIIPDEFIFSLLILNFLVFPFFLGNIMYDHLFAGFLVSIFLFILHVVTYGKGMGLGDVKLALFAGGFFGLTSSITWIFLSFVLGAAIGILLLVFNKVKFGRKIAFGPFLVISFFIVLFFSKQITSIILPFRM